MIVSGLAMAVALAAILVGILAYCLDARIDSKEPPFIPSRIPVIGHIINLFRYGQLYYIQLDRGQHRGLYTIQLGPGRMYVASSPEWCQAVHKNHRTLVFSTLMTAAMEKVFLLDKDAMDIVKNNVNMDEGNHGIMAAIHDDCYPFLAPGQSLDMMNQEFLRAMAKEVSTLASGSKSDTVSLYKWIRHHFSMASMYAVYGPENIFAEDPRLESMFWEFEAGLGAFFVSPAPSLTSPKAEKGRRACLEALEEYVAKERYKQASPFIQARFSALFNHGMSPKMSAYGELSLIFGLLANSIPSCFWVLSWISSDDKILSEVRAEVEQCTRSEGKRRIINATRIKSSCPLLLSTLREVLRLSAPMNAMRYVLTDTLLTATGTNETYLLKHGNLVLSAANVVHQQQGTWGGDAGDFNPRRFFQELNQDASVDLSRAAQAVPDRKVHPGAFRAFGSGINLCPGRHFAHTEIVALVALFVTAFDVSDAKTGEKFDLPKMEDDKIMIGVVKPKKDVEIMVRRREGLEEVDWEFEM